MVCKWQVEIDEYANRVLAKHWPNVRRWPDVRTWPQPDTERVDVICGGFPCQDISYAGLGAGLDGARSGLFFEVIRVVQQLQPRVVVLENVAALLTRGLDRVLGSLAEIGFDAEWHCIPAAAVGAPHRRDRVFIIATNANRNNDPSAKNAIGINSRIDHSIHFVEWHSRNEQLARGRRVIRRDTYAGIVRAVHGIPHRVDRLRGLGNAVVPQVAEFIGRRIVEAVNETQKGSEVV